MTMMEAKEYLMNHFGLLDSELFGLDAIRFIQDYEVDERDYSADEIRELIIDEGMSYIDDGSTEIYSLLNVDGADRTIPEDAEIRKIGFSFNNGTFYQICVYDLIKKVYYVDDAKENILADDRHNSLSSLVRTYQIYNWLTSYSGQDTMSTGWLSWKIVFEDEQGINYTYSGSTRDGKPLPENFAAVVKELLVQ